MEINDNFAICFGYCGKFFRKDDRMEYIRGDFKNKLGLDKDRFGFLDLSAEVESLGLVSWSKLWYRIPKTDIYKVITDDKEIMEMLTLIDKKNRVINVFVEGSVTLDDTTDDVMVDDVMVDREDGDVLGKDNETDSDDTEHAPSESELDDVSLDELDYISDETYTNARRNMNKVNSVFDVISMDDGFEDIDLGHETVSECEISDDDVPSKSEGENEGRACMKNCIVYDPKCNHENLNIVLGMQFKDGLQCREALRTWGIENGKFVQFRCVSKTKLVAVCKPPCPWKVYGSMVKSSETFMIRSYWGYHNCPRAMTNKLISSKWIGQKIFECIQSKI
ncbi:uncharacterized protein LOC131011334 isoform X2 [Salvia miltiorrhiza]|uniref:uncharacterized protein LOC131011334 isoform X2 n=1 Tax=Salvia miltiorrhiza TaxID=226208 RepID=UPI0025ABF3EE|nr:uncharacterized protein LOC131011334 isoform X2 [Salvia miltiorrhiza]